MKILSEALDKIDNNNSKNEYYLTDIGYTLRPVSESMQKWGKEYKRLRKLIDLSVRSEYINKSSLPFRCDVSAL